MKIIDSMVSIPFVALGIGLKPVNLVQSLNIFDCGDLSEISVII